MPIKKRKKITNKKLVQTKVLIKTEISALAAIALFFAAIPLAMLIGVWTAFFAIVIVKY